MIAVRLEIILLAKRGLKENWIAFKMSRSRMLLFSACVFIFSICHAKRTDFGHLKNKLETLISKTERFANETDVRNEFAVRSAINEDFSQILEKLDAMQDKLKTAKKALNQKLKSASKTLNKTIKNANRALHQSLESANQAQNKRLETANQALNQIILEIQVANENMVTELTKLQDNCTCSSATASPLSPITIQTTSTESTTTTSATTTLGMTTPVTTSPLCDEGWTRFNDHCYLAALKESKTWDDSLAYCALRKHAHAVYSNISRL